MPILYILCSFGTLFPVLVSCTKKDLATLVAHFYGPPTPSPFVELDKVVVVGVRSRQVEPLGSGLQAFRECSVQTFGAGGTNLAEQIL
jgi:hypothetical protein